MVRKAVSWERSIAQKSQRDLLKLIRSLDEDLFKAIRVAQARAASIIADLPGQNVSAVVRRAMYQQQRRALLRVYNELWQGKVTPAVLKAIEQAAKRSVVAQRQLLEVLLRATPGGADELAKSLLAASERSWKVLQARLINDIKLSPSVYKNQALMAGKVDTIVNNGLALRQSAKEIAGEVVKYINPDVMGGTRYAALRLGRTEVGNAAHTMNRLTARESKYIVGVEWHLSASHPRPDECDLLDGRVFKPKSVPDKPHPNDMCYTIPVTMDQSEFNRRLVSGRF